MRYFDDNHRSETSRFQSKVIEAFQNEIDKARRKNPFEQGALQCFSGRCASEEMNRLVQTLARRCARLCLNAQRSSSIAVASTSSTSSIYMPRRLPPFPASTMLPMEEPPSAFDDVKYTPLVLPGLSSTNLIYTFPTTHQEPILDPPPFLSELFEKCDPEVKTPIEAPPVVTPTAMYAGPHMLVIRRKKMKKHKRRKRFFRDFFKYQKYHREKKLRAEREFRARMKAMFAELESFNPEDYVNETIAKAQQEWSSELAPTGRKIYPHWSRLMALEELYGLEKDDYIDKNAGIPDEEGQMRVEKMREQYKKTFGLATKKASSGSTAS